MVRPLVVEWESKVTVVVEWKKLNKFSVSFVHVCCCCCCCCSDNHPCTNVDERNLCNSDDSIVHHDVTKMMTIDDTDYSSYNDVSNHYHHRLHTAYPCNFLHDSTADSDDDRSLDILLSLLSSRKIDHEYRHTLRIDKDNPNICILFETNRSKTNQHWSHETLSSVLK